MNILDRYVAKLKCLVVSSKSTLVPFVEHYYAYKGKLPFVVQLNHLLSSEQESLFHKHSFIGLSIVLSGGYEEERLGPNLNTVRRFLRPGDVNVFTGGEVHRISHVDPNTWTLHILSKPLFIWGTFREIDRHDWSFSEHGVEDYVTRLK